MGPRASALQMSRNLQVCAGAALLPPGPPRGCVCLRVRGFPRGSAAGSAVWAPGEGGQGYLKDRQPF